MSSTFHLVMSCVSRWCGRIRRRPWRAPAKFHVRAAIGRPIIYIFFLRFTVFLFLAPVFAAVFLSLFLSLFFATLRFLAIAITSFLDKILQHHSDLSKKICKLCAMFTLGSRRATVEKRMMHASFLERYEFGANLWRRRKRVTTSGSGRMKWRCAAHFYRFVGSFFRGVHPICATKSPRLPGNALPCGSDLRIAENA